MEAHITLDARIKDEIAGEAIKKLLQSFRGGDAHDLSKKYPDLFSMELQHAVNTLSKGYADIIAGLEYVDFTDSRVKAGFVGGMDSEEFALALATVIYGVGCADFELIVRADEAICIIGIQGRLVAQEYFNSIDDYYKTGFQNPTYLQPWPTGAGDQFP